MESQFLSFSSGSLSGEARNAESFDSISFKYVEQIASLFFIAIFPLGLPKWDFAPVVTGLLFRNDLVKDTEQNRIRFSCR